MSSQALLKAIGGDKPLLNMQFGILSAPVRHVFMMGVVWMLTRRGARPDMQVMEVGSWYGASALSWGAGLTTYNDAQGTLTCIDPWAPYLDPSRHTDEVYLAAEAALGSEAAYNIFLHNIRTLPATINTQHFRAPAANALPLLGEGAFDVVYIDGDHIYQPAKQDITMGLRLVREGGVICGDDLNLQLADVDQAHALAHRDFDFIRDPKTGRNHHPGVTLAVAEIFGEVSMWGGFWAMQKVGGEWRKFSLADMPIVYPDHLPPDAIERAKTHLADISPIA